MKFAFDFDGVISEMPELFSTVTMALKAAGHQIYIVTDFDEHYRQYRERELADLSIAYDQLVITSNKQQFMLEEGVSYAFDDDPEYYRTNKSLSLFAFSSANRG